MSLSPSFSYDERTDYHQWVNARSVFGGNGSSLNVKGHLTQIDAEIDERVALYSVGRTVSYTPEIHQSEHEYSIGGQLLCFETAVYGAYGMAIALHDNLQRINAPEPAAMRAEYGLMREMEPLW
jgi:hypothetical protein